MIDAEGFSADKEDKLPRYNTREAERSRRAWMLPLNMPIEARTQRPLLEPVPGWIRAGGGWWRSRGV